MFTSISFHAPTIHFENHRKSDSGHMTWVNFSIRDSGNDGSGGEVHFTVYRPHPELVRFLYTMNKPDEDEVSTPENGVEKIIVDEIPF